MADEIRVPLTFDDQPVLTSLKNVEKGLTDIKVASDDLTNAISKDMGEASEATEDFETALNGAAKTTDKLSNEVKQSNEILSQHKRQLIDNIKNYKIFGVSINDIQGKLKLMQAGFKTATAGTSLLSRGMKLLKVAIIGTGIGALVVALGSLVAFFTKSAAGAEKLRVIFKQVGAVVNVIVDRFAALGKLFSEGGLINGIRNIGKAFKGVNKEIAEEVKLTKQLEEQLIKLEKAEVILNAQAVKRRATIKELNKIGEDVTKSERTRIEALREAAAIERDLLQDQIKLGRQKLENYVAENAELGRTDELLKLVSKEFTTVEQAAADADAIISKLGLSDSDLEDLKTFTGLYEDLAAKQAQSAEIQTTLQNKINTIEREGTARREKAATERAKILNDLLKQLNEVDKAVQGNAAKVEDNRDQAQKLYDAYTLARQEVEKLRDAFAEFYKEAGRPVPQELESTFNRVFKGLKENFERELEDIQTIETIPGIVTQVKSQFDEQLANRFDEGAPISLREAVNIFLSDLFGGASLEELKTIEEAVLSTFGSIAEAMTITLEAEIEAQEKLIDAIEDRVGEQERIVQEQRRLAEQGFANNLDAEQAYLDDLQAQRDDAEAKRLELAKKAANQQLIIDGATQVSALATSAANFFKTSSNIPIVGIALAISAIASMYALFAKAKAQAKALASPQILRKGAKLEGPSHENDGIPLIVNTKKGQRVYEAEGDEWLIGTAPSKEHDKFLGRLNSGEFNGLNLNSLVSRRESPISSAMASVRTTEGNLRASTRAYETKILVNAYMKGADKIIEAIRSQPIPYKDGFLQREGSSLRHRKI